MPILTHITSDKNRKSVERSGIKIPRIRGVYGIGVYCMPVLPNFFASHQWLRELRRSGQRVLIACDFRLPDDEPVLIGHYNSEKAQLPAGEAIGIIMKADDPRGYEIIVPRKIEAKEITKFRNIPQVVGWRYFPNSHGRRPCPCPACGMAGNIKDRALRKRLLEEQGELKPAKDDIRKLLKEASTTEDIEYALDQTGFYTWKSSDDVIHLGNHSDPDVLESLAFALLQYRDQQSVEILKNLCLHSEDAVRSAAAFSLLRRIKKEGVLWLRSQRLDAVITKELDEYEQEASS